MSNKLEELKETKRGIDALQEKRSREQQEIIKEIGKLRHKQTALLASAIVEEGMLADLSWNLYEAPGTDKAWELQAPLQKENPLQELDNEVGHLRCMIGKGCLDVANIGASLTARIEVSPEDIYEFCQEHGITLHSIDLMERYYFDRGEAVKALKDFVQDEVDS